jgi:hypothetical protein
LARGEMLRGFKSFLILFYFNFWRNNMDKKDSEKLLSTVSALREEVKKATPDPVKMEKMNTFLDGLEEANQKIVAEKAAAAQEALELKERLEGLEVEITRKSKESGGSAVKKALLIWTLNSKHCFALTLILRVDIWFLMKWIQ